MSYPETPLLTGGRRCLKADMFQAALEFQKQQTPDTAANLTRRLQLVYPDAPSEEIQSYFNNLLSNSTKDLKSGLDYFQRTKRQP
jgi:hypothetical protein